VALKRAFTALEMLVALTVVILLAAMLMPVFLKAKGRSHVAVCISNLRQIHHALQLYRNDHFEYPKNSFHSEYWGGREESEAFLRLSCPAWRSLGCDFDGRSSELCDPWYPYTPIWDGLYATDPTRGESKELWERCRDSRGDALPITLDTNHAVSPVQKHREVPGEPVLILREGGQVTVHKAPLRRMARNEDPECPYGSPFNY
jgi:type II secretory pathway pseudopilin PulG